MRLLICRNISARACSVFPYVCVQSVWTSVIYFMYTPAMTSGSLITYRTLFLFFWNSFIHGERKSGSIHFHSKHHLFNIAVDFLCAWRWFVANNTSSIVASASQTELSCTRNSITFATMSASSTSEKPKTKEDKKTLSWSEYFMAVARLSSTRSKDRKTQVCEPKSAVAEHVSATADIYSYMHTQTTTVTHFFSNWTPSFLRAWYTLFLCAPMHLYLYVRMRLHTVAYVSSYMAIYSILRGWIKRAARSMFAIIIAHFFRSHDQYSTLGGSHMTNLEHLGESHDQSRTLGGVTWPIYNTLE